MTFLSPYYLFGLLGLAVPVIIHLWSRKNPRVILFGSVRFFSEAKASRQMSLYLTEKRLLLLRMALFTVFVLILANPAIKNQEDKEHWTLVDPVLADSPEIKALGDSVELRYLVNGFPLVGEAETPVATPGKQWDLIREAAQKVDSLTIVSSDFRKNFSGLRPVITVPFHWISLRTDPSPTQQDTLYTYTGNSGNRHIIQLTSTRTSTAINHEVTPGSSGTPDTLHFQLIEGEDKDQNVLIYQAIQTLGQFTDLPVMIDSSPTSAATDPDWVINLSTDEYLPNDSVKVLQLSAEQPGEIILETDNPNIYLLNGKLTVARLMTDGFLRHWLMLTDPFSANNLEERINHMDQRIMPMDPAPVLTAAYEVKKAEAKPYVWPFWLLLVLLIIIERLVARKRHA